MKNNYFILPISLFIIHIMASDKMVTINSVKFLAKKLTETFPNSYFTCLFNKFSESKKLHIKITFPETEFDESAGTRYMKQIKFRMKKGYYQYPAIDPTTKYAIVPIADGNKFCSMEEMEKIFDFLLFSKSELNLVEKIPEKYIDENVDEYSEDEDECDKYNEYFDKYNNEKYLDECDYGLLEPNLFDPYDEDEELR